MSDITINNGSPFYGIPRSDSKPADRVLGRQIKQFVEDKRISPTLQNKSLEATAELSLRGLKGRSKEENIRFDDILSYTTTIEDLKFFYDTIKYYQNKTEPLVSNKPLNKFFNKCINKIEEKINNTTDQKSSSEQTIPSVTLEKAPNKEAIILPVPNNEIQLLISKNTPIVVRNVSLSSIIKQSGSSSDKPLVAVIVRDRYRNHLLSIKQRLTLESHPKIPSKSRLEESFKKRQPATSISTEPKFGGDATSLNNPPDRQNSDSQLEVPQETPETGGNATATDGGTITHDKTASADEDAIQHVNQPFDDSATLTRLLKTSTDPNQQSQLKEFPPTLVLPDKVSNSLQSSPWFPGNLLATSSIAAEKSEKLEKYSKKSEQEHLALQSLIDSLEDLFKEDKEVSENTETSHKGIKRKLIAGDLISRLKEINLSVQIFINQALKSSDPCLA